MLNSRFGGLLSVLIGIFFLVTFITSDSVKSEDDLQTISTTVESYSFNRTSSGGRRYLILTREHECRFQIRAEDIDNFNQKAFVKNIGVGSELKLMIHKGISDLDNNQRIHLFGVMDDNISYLNTRQVIETYNSIWKYLAAIGFIVFGIFLFLGLRLNIRRPAYMPKRR